MRKERSMREMVFSNYILLICGCVLYVYYSCCFASMTGLDLDHFIQPLISYVEIIVCSKITLMQSYI